MPPSRVPGPSRAVPGAGAQAAPEGLEGRGVRLLEGLGGGPHGPTWRARLDDGTPVTAKRLAKARGPAARLLKRLRTAADLREAHLVPIRDAFVVGREVWVVSELDDGLPLSELLASARLPRAGALAAGLGVLSGLTSLHAAGLWHGALHPGNVYVGRDGEVRIGHFGLTPLAPGAAFAALRAADVRAAGAILCGLLRIPSEPGRRAPAVAQTPIGTAARAMTRVRESRHGYEVARASLALWEAGGRLASSRRQAEARQQLAALVRSLQAPAADPQAPLAPDLGPGPAPAGRVESVPVAPAGPPLPARTAPSRRAVGVGLGVLAACALLTIASFSFPHPPPRLSGEVAPTPVAGRSTPTPGPTPRPAPSPTSPAPAGPAPIAPSSAGAVTAVVASFGGGRCVPGTTCTVAVEVRITPAATARAVSWVLQSVDACSGAAAPLARDTVVARPGWTSVVGTSEITLPAGSRSLVAVAVAPARAASAPLTGGDPPPC